MNKTKKILTGILCLVTAVCLVIGIGSFGINANADSPDSLVMAKGAAVRIDDSCTGMRFTAAMGKAAYEKIADNVVSGGMFIMPEDYVAKYGDLTEENLFGGNAVYSGEINDKITIIDIVYGGMTYSEQNARYEIKGTISNIIEKNYSRNFIARAYLKMKDGSVILAAYEDNNSVNNVRSIQNVAKIALADGSVDYTGKELSVLGDYTDFSAQISGDRYLPLFEPQGNGTIAWDSLEKAYKFSFTSNDGDERGFCINSDFFHKTAQKTGATQLKFKMKAASSDFQHVYFGYMPNWWNQNGDNMTAYSVTTEYAEYSFDFDTLPRENGSFKTPFVLAVAGNGVQSGLYIKDIEVVKPYELSAAIDADKLIVEGAKVNLGDLKFALSQSFPAGATGKVLKSGRTEEIGWQGNSFKLPTAVPAADYKALSLRLYVECAEKDYVNAVMFKYGDTNGGNVVYNKNIPTNRWYNLTVDASSIINDGGMIEGVAMSIATSTFATVYIDTVSLLQDNEKIEYLVNNGITEYFVLIPNNASETILKAKDEFTTLFKKATSATLSFVTEAADGQKYISLGNTSLFENSGYSAEEGELGASGYKLITEGTNIYVCGGTDTATLYGVYGLLAELFDFDVYYTDSYSINEGVYTLALPELNVIDIPDIEHRVSGNYGITSDTTAKDRFRYEYYGDNFILVGGEVSHNSLHYVQGKANESDDWYNKNGKSIFSKLLKTQLCYTARGNSEAYNNMVAAAAKTLEDALIANPDKNVVTFSEQDNYDACKCSACQKSNSDGYNETDRVIAFVNVVYGKILNWFNGDGAEYKRDLDMVVYAYLSTADAPLKTRPVSGVKILYAPIGFDFTSDITASINSELYEEAQKWNEMTDEIYFWIYSANFYYYLAPYLNVDGMQSYYRFAKSAGAKWIFDQAQHDNTFATGFGNLKSYLASKLAWDAESDIAALTDKFFNGYFGPASAKMRAFYNEFNAAYKNASGLHITTSCQVQPKAEYWTKDALIGWVVDCASALDMIEPLKTTDSAAYETYRKHIVGERISVLYLLIELYRGEIDAVTKNAYIETFKSDVLEAGVRYPRESGAQTFDDLYSSWGTASAVAAVADLANPSASVAVSGTVTQVTLKGATVSANNYVAANGLLTLKGEYLGELGEGNYVFGVTLSDGAIDWYVTVTDNELPAYEIKKESSYEEGEITLPIATSKDGSYQRLTPIYYLDGEQKEEGERLTLKEGTYALTVKFMRNGKLIDGGDISAEIVVLAKSYVLGDGIDFAEITFVNLEDFGLKNIWNQGVVEASEAPIGPNGKVLQMFNGETVDVGSHVSAVRLNNPITLKDRMNYIRLRMYISSLSVTKANIRFYRSDRTNHQVEPDVWYDYACDIQTNKWVNVYLKTSEFAVDGKISGYDFMCSTSLVGGKIYVDDIAVVTDNYTLGEEIDMTNENVSAENAGLSGLWNKNAYLIPEGDANYVAGGKGYEYFLTTDGSPNLAGYISIKDAIKVKNNFNYIRLRMYVKSSGTNATELRFYRSDRTNHQVETNVYYDAVANVAVNAWVNVYVPVKSFAINGKVNGIKIGAVGQTSVSGIYIDDLTITKVQGTEVSLNGSQIGYPGFGNQWNDGTAVTKDYIELTNGGSYSAAKITFAAPVTVTTEKSMVITLSANVKPCRIAIFKYSKTAADVLDYYYDNCPANESVTMTIGISQFVENGVLNGFTIALWGDASGIDVTIEGVIVV